MASLIAPNASIKAALEALKFFESICQAGRDIGSRFAVQTLCLDEPGTSGRIPERAFQISSGSERGCADSSDPQRHFRQPPALGV